MNKEFRAYDKYIKCYMINGFKINNDGYCLDYDNVPRDNVILEQWTGLLDKHGKKIFEGDIIGGVLYKDGSEHIGRILYDFNGYRILTKEKSMPLDLTEKLRVIGNIHENPELLTEETK